MSKRKQLYQLHEPYLTTLLASGMILTHELEGTGYHCSDVVVMDGSIVNFVITNGTERRVEKARITPMMSADYVESEYQPAMMRLIEWAKQNG